jgi:hypothetical protein
VRHGGKQGRRQRSNSSDSGDGRHVDWIVEWDGIEYVICSSWKV